MRVKVIYRKNLKMSNGKLAAQVAHAVRILIGHYEPGRFDDCNIVVLGVSDKKFKTLVVRNQAVVQVDKGLTEVKQDTQTAAAWIDPIVPPEEPTTRLGKARKIAVLVDCAIQNGWSREDQAEIVKEELDAIIDKEVENRACSHMSTRTDDTIDW